MKRWYQSRTIWGNIAVGFIAIGTEAAFLIEEVPDDWQSLVRVGLSGLVMVGNVIIRMDTKKAIK